MAEVHYENIIELLNECPSKVEIRKSEEPCNHCEFRNSLDCKTALMRKAAIDIQQLQEIVNEYSKYDGFLYAHGFFRPKDEVSECKEVPYVTTCASSDTTVKVLDFNNHQSIDDVEDHRYIVTITQNDTHSRNGA